MGQPKLFGGSLEEYCEVSSIYRSKSSFHLVIGKFLRLRKEEIPCELKLLCLIQNYLKIKHSHKISDLTCFSLKATGQEIPLVVKSCIRAINLYGK